LTAGKAAVQVAHAAVMLVDQATARHRAQLDAWRAQGQKKIGLVVPSLDDLERLEHSARTRGISTVWVKDAGLTEVPPGTVTCLGLGPALAADIDPITGELALL
jgi:PTH2 family peptidyl-tRNA hydrolase